MEDKEIEVDVQKFDGVDYFLYETVEKDMEKYDIFAKIDDPTDILIAKEIIKDNEVYYEVVKDEKLFLDIILLCNENM